MVVVCATLAEGVHCAAVRYLLLPRLVGRSQLLPLSTVPLPGVEKSCCKRQQSGVRCVFFSPTRLANAHAHISFAAQAGANMLLHISKSSGDLLVAEYLVEHGAEINVRTEVCRDWKSVSALNRLD
jgi:hypothetical protein